jgi:subtilase family serine protease
MQPAPLSRSGARLEKAAALGNVKHLRLYFTSPDAAALNSAAQAIASPSSPDYRHYLTVNQFRALYAPPAATTAAVNSYLTGLGLRVGPLDPNGMSEPVTGTIKQLNAALHTTLQQVRTAAGAQVVGATEAPALPANLAGAVTYIDGLTPWVQAHDNLASAPANSTVRPPGGAQPAVGTKPAVAAVQQCSALSGLPTDGMLPDNLASAYKLSGFYASSDTGQGVTVGLIEYDSYDATAVLVWKQCLGVLPTIYVEQDPTNPAPSPPAHPEATADIETLMSIAPSANIAVYETANLVGVNLDPWNEAITGAGSTAPTPSVISSSWGLCEPQEGTSTSAVYGQESTLFSEALMQGQTILVASGDYGSEGCAGTSQLAVSDPASNPLVTAVGGTASDTVTGPQYVWNSKLATASSCLGNCVPGASGGGLSQVWAQPTYQSANASLQTGCSSAELTEPPVSGPGSGGCREVPDVSALAGNWYWQICQSTGTGGPCTGSSTTSPFIVGAGGTSLAAPSWAGAVALANEECKTNVGFLNPILYQYTSQSNPVVGPVTTGNNDFSQTNGGSYPAQSNGSQNLATGLGYLGGVDLSSGGLCLPPSVPTAVTTVPANGAVTVSWAAPKYQGGSAVTGYTVSMTPATDPPCTVTLPAATSCTFSGLTNGTPYRFTLTASNSSGPGIPLTTSWVTPVPNVSFPGFNKVAGAAVAVSEGANGMVWVLGTASTGGGHPLYERVGNGWLQRAGGAVAIAVGPNGNPWVVNNAHQIYAFNGSAFVHQPGSAVAVSVGANGSVWVLGSAAVPGGHPIYQWTGSTWVLQPGGASSIGVGPTGNPWVTNSGGNIFEWNGSGWYLQSGLAAAIGEGGDGAVWILGNGAAPGGHFIYLWTAAGWSSRPGGATAITVGPAGDPWVVNSTGAIYSS